MGNYIFIHFNLQWPLSIPLTIRAPARRLSVPCNVTASLAPSPPPLLFGLPLKRKRPK